MNKLSIAAMMAIARTRGGRCLSAQYLNSSVPLLWQCALGHRWRAVPGSIRKGSWCPTCAGVRRLTIDQMRGIADSRGGCCLSETYTNNASKVRWRCSSGHEWSATPLQVKKGHWCPFCARVAPLTLETLRQLAGSKGGRCLSQEYVNSAYPLRWECAAGHEWIARPSGIRAGNWCPACAHNQRLGLQEMRKIARARGGRCLSAIYENGRTPLLWVCGHGHYWKAWPARVKGGFRRKGTWCRECYNWRRKFRAKHSIEAMRRLATTRGGKCLSAEYSGSKAKLVWLCALGHRWQASPAYVVEGTWCPVCARNQRLSLGLFHDLAATRGGECMSQTYVNERTPLWWRCETGHVWEAAPGKVKGGSWCPTCVPREQVGGEGFIFRGEAGIIEWPGVGCGGAQNWIFVRVAPERWIGKRGEVGEAREGQREEGEEGGCNLRRGLWVERKRGEGWGACRVAAD